MIRSDIFLASAVTQNEVIHANSKDVDAIFKIQAANTSLDPSDQAAVFAYLL